jgi:hypothetical protein
MTDPATTNFEAASELLDDYVRAVLDDALAHDYEEDLFARSLRGRAPELAFRVGLGATLRKMDARGTLEVWITSRDVERLRGLGLRTVVFELDLQNPSAPEIPPGTDLFIARIPLDLTGVRSVELEALSSDGRVLKRMPDVRFDPADGAIYACCEADLARIAANADRTTRFWAVDDSGARRLLLELLGV